MRKFFSSLLNGIWQFVVVSLPGWADCVENWVRKRIPFIFRARTTAVTASWWVYFLLFSVGAANILVLVLYGKTSTQALGTDKWFALVFAVATIIQQAFVYHDLHEIESKPADRVDQQYGSWLQMRSEFVIRLLLLFFLLVCVGKVYEPLKKLAIGVLTEDRLRAFLALLPECLRNVLSHEWGVYVIGSLCAYFLLLLWNFGAERGAARVSLVPPAGMVKGTKEYGESIARQQAMKDVVIYRIRSYSLLALLGIGYWSTVLKSIAVGAELDADVARFLVGLFLCAVVGAACLTFTFGFEHAVQKVMRRYSDFAAALK